MAKRSLWNLRFPGSKWIGWGSLLLITLLMGCASETPVQPLIATATPSTRPTPTLAPAARPPSEERPFAEVVTTSDLPAEEELLSATPETPQPDQEADEGPAVPAATIDPALEPADLLLLADRALEIGDYQQAGDTYLSITGDDRATPEQAAAGWLGLGRAQLEMSRPVSALGSFEAYLALADPPDSRVYFWLASAEPDSVKSAAYLQAYLAENPDMSAYIEPRLALLLPDETESRLLAALEGDAQYLVLVTLRLQLADFYLEQGRYQEAIEQYTAVRSLARTEITRGEMTYRIGQAYMLAGDEENALAAYAFAVDNYPKSYQTYQGLVTLVEAGRPVDDYQRGIIDYYAKAYAPGVDALQNYIATTDPYRPDAHLFLAWSYEGLGEFTNALEQLDRYLALDPQNPAVIGTTIEEKAALLTRSVSTSQAIDALQDFARRYPEHPLVPWALYRSAVLADRFRQDFDQAIPLYERFVGAFPDHPQASEALFRLGMMHLDGDELPMAQEYWQQAAGYDDEFGRAALVWLIRTADAETAAGYKTQAAAATGSDYYTLRARDIGQTRPPYPAAGAVTTEFDEAAAQREVEAWIKSHFGLAEDAAVSSKLDPAIATDPRLIRGEKLWHLGLKTEAKQELEAVREQYAQNAQLSYQLALYFRDLGLYRSSILAAASVLTRARVTTFEAPSLIGRLAYPIYYHDLVLPLADRYGYDPLLQFAQIRQESLFESFITSVAAAQGLTQIIPDTGEYIANRLQWPNYQFSDLNRPTVNLQFGAYYLDQQLDLFDGTIAPALAAYNAGPGNALGWYEAAGDDHDLYLETVNFAETRLYIQRIYIGHAVYKHLYEEKADS